MTQRSQPAQDHVNNYPTSDAGPYSADEWSDMFASLFSTDEADQGPLIRYLNELEVTDDALDIDVDTGGAMVDGHWFKNDASLAFTIPHPAANPRIDRVVVCVNNTAVVMTVSDLGFALDFPDDLTDYNLTASVEPYSTRLVIVQGTEAVGPVAPGLDQNNNHFMIPLYQYQISVAGAISAGTDQRDFCNFASTVQTRTELILADNNAYLTNLQGAILSNGVDNTTYGGWVVPVYFKSNLVITPVVIPNGTGNIVVRSEAFLGECEQAYNTHTYNSGALQVVAMPVALRNRCLSALAFTCTAAVVGDIMHLRFQRDGTDILDTMASNLNVRGWLASYNSNN